MIVVLYAVCVDNYIHEGLNDAASSEQVQPVASPFKPLGKRKTQRRDQDDTDIVDTLLEPPLTALNSSDAPTIRPPRIEHMNSELSHHISHAEPAASLGYVIHSDTLTPALMNILSIAPLL